MACTPALGLIHRFDRAIITGAAGAKRAAFLESTDLNSSAVAATFNAVHNAACRHARSASTAPLRLLSPATTPAASQA